MAKEERYKVPTAVGQIAQKYGYHVLWLPPYHPDLNPTEEAWGITKGHVFYNNDGSNFQKVKDLIMEGIDKAHPTWPKLVERTIANERKYISEDRINLNQRSIVRKNISPIASSTFIVHIVLRGRLLVLGWIIESDHSLWQIHTLEAKGQWVNPQAVEPKMLDEEQEIFIPSFYTPGLLSTCILISKGAVACIGHYHNISSYYQTAEYLVLVPSKHQPEILVQSPKPLFHSEIRAAEFRSEKRVQISSLTTTDQKRKLEEESERVLKKACLGSLADHVKLGAYRLAKNDKLSDPIEINILKDSLANLRLPPFTLDKAVRIFRDDPDHCSDISEDDLLKNLRTRKTNKATWQGAVASDFESIYKSCAKNLGKDMAEDQTIGEDENGGDVDDSDVHNVGDTKVLRTCTIALKQILRPDFLGNNDGGGTTGELEHIVSIAENRQEILTNVIEEVSILARKTVYLIAGGDVYGSNHGFIESKTFDIQAALPSSFKLRDLSIDPLLNVTTIPETLQEQIEVSMNKKDSAKSDLSNLLSLKHLQYLYSQFLGVRKSHKKSTANPHSLWDRITDLINEQSNPPDCHLAAEGLSFTINEHLVQLSTAITNTWEGSIYSKSMDYLLRILLRLHLAPKRESKYKERIESMRQKNNEPKKPPTMTKTLWRWKVNRLCDQFSEVLQHRDRLRNTATRIDSIVKKLLELQSLEPEALDRKFPSLEKQLQAMDTARPDATDRLADLELTDEMEFEEDDFEDYEDFEDFEEGENSDDHTSEPSRKHLRSLQCLLKMLLESPHIIKKIDANWVQKAAYSGSNFTPRECKVVADLANLFRPYVPKRWKDSDGIYHEPVAHVTLRAPLVLITNAILRVTGYHKFARRVSPHISPSSTHGLILGAKGIFEVFCSRSTNQYSIVGNDSTPLTNGNNVSKNKEAIFASFFNMKKLRELCLSFGLKFAYRMIFVDRYTVRIMGEVIQRGQERKGHHISSEYEARKKDKKTTKSWVNWDEEFRSLSMTIEEVKEMADSAADAVEKEKSTVTKMRRKLTKLQGNQVIASHANAQSHTYETYEKLREARKEVRDVRSVLLPHENMLRDLSQEAYYWNNVNRAAKSHQNEDKLKRKRYKGSRKHKKGPTNAKITTPTWSHYNVEDATESLDITKYKAYQQPRQKEAIGFLRQYNVLVLIVDGIPFLLQAYNQGTDGPDPLHIETTTEACSTSSAVMDSAFIEPKKAALKSLMLPKAHKITATQINEVSHSRRHNKRRENRLKMKANKDTQKALKDISNKEAVLESCTTLEEIDTAHSFRQSSGKILRAFEKSKAQVKDLQTQRLRTHQAWSKVTASERRYFKDHARKSIEESDMSVSTEDGWCNRCNQHHIARTSDQPFDHSSVCPKSRQLVLPIMLVGSAGTGVGSRIGGHARRGGKKLREHHQRYCAISPHKLACFASTKWSQPVRVDLLMAKSRR
ncbi:hypothetical protein BGZ46_007984 [Entomortierella lignicola]|nr:hypothetical protein BGZ46_007984 [Entomortierella lignicola]